ncbi:hypothetical protein [Kordia sp.]|uniref:hypothetical protein n=1 Tax=Kordia sp. TaxID=1965332 RepID=UPI003B5BAAE2
MKFIYYTNNIFYYITLALYLTIIYGMFMQILLGGIQIILFFVLLFNFDKFSEKIKQHLSIYGILSTIFLLCFFYWVTIGEGSPLSGTLTMCLIILLPMSLGTYFTYIVYQLKQQVL